MSNLANYSPNNQIELMSLTLTKGSQILDIIQILEQFIVYEDMLGGPMSARLIFKDQLNLVGSLPITGGEIVKIKYRTPVHIEAVNLEFIVYRVGERGKNNSSENIGMDQLYLCTPETWWGAANEVASYFKGTYSDIITQILKEPASKKSVDKEESIGIVEYVAPSIPAWTAIKFCASRANSRTLSPMFFWETTDGFKFKSLKEVYRAPQFKFLYIEDRSVSGVENNPEKVFNTTFGVEYPESNDRLTQAATNAFGADNFMVDPVNKRIVKVRNSYDDLFGKNDIKLNKFALNKVEGVKDAYIPYRADNSHMTQWNRQSSLALMDNLKLMVSIPGDSKLQSGHVVWLEIPSKVGLSIGKEEHSSGKWLVRSIKHLITKTTFTQTCELTKDSFDADVKGS